MLSAGKCVRASNELFFFSSDWLRKWRELSLQITGRRKATPPQTQHHFQPSIETAQVTLLPR